MSDPTDVLGPGLKAWIEGDTEVITAFGSHPVQVFDIIPPTNARTPYIFLAGIDPDHISADCLDAANVNLQIDVWSLTSPPGFAQARAMAQAVLAAVMRCADSGDSPVFTISGYRVSAAVPIATQYLTDPSDGKTVHAVLTARLEVEPT